MAYAQTNVQLYNQLRRLDWSDEDLRHVQAAYHLAMRVVAGHFRPSERPFLSHLVGVASILAECRAPATVVAAGLLHAVYTQGEFGDGSRGASEDKRRQVRRAVGAASEELVARYAATSWTVATLRELAARAGHPAAIDAAVALMKLADTLEECSDLGVHGSPPPADARADRREWLEAAVALAQCLGQERLAAELAEAAAADVIPLPEFLHSGHDGSFTVAPMSHGMRTAVRLGQFYRQVRDRVLAVRVSQPKAA